MVRLAPMQRERSKVEMPARSAKVAKVCRRSYPAQRRDSCVLMRLLCADGDAAKKRDALEREHRCVGVVPGRCRGVDTSGESPHARLDPPAGRCRDVDSTEERAHGQPRAWCELGPAQVDDRITRISRELTAPRPSGAVPRRLFARGRRVYL
jgi:hypothetical protein